ncbi:MAG: hypothetical protein GY782_07845 [Gammaproteobacteria bacterium]|nr:hypothetical protein [Gammaproteobacteria bacterium]
MATKLYDIVVKTGEYVNGQGETKSRYENIGSVMQGDKGQFAIIKRTFNPAGVPNPDNKDSVIASFFEQNNNQQNGQQQQQQPMQNQQQQGGWGQPQQNNQQQQQQYNNGPQFQ